MPFKKGQSGNPSGMKKGTKTRHTMVKEALQRRGPFKGVEAEIDNLVHLMFSVNPKTRRDAALMLTTTLNRTKP